MTFKVLNVISFLISKLGHHGIKWFATALGMLLYDVFRIRRKVILKNLDIAFSDSKTQTEKVKIGRSSVISFIQTALELLSADKLFPKNRVKFYNPENALKLLQRKEGLYAMCIHIGNWEYLCHISSKLFAPVHVVVKPIGKGKLAQWIEDMRARIGYRIIDRKGELSPTTQIFKALDNGEIIGFIVDQKRPKGEYLPFFGKEASTNNSLAKLWLKRKAPIIPVIIKRTHFNAHEVYFLNEFNMTEDNSLTPEENITANTLKMNKTVEEMIKFNPEEYFWMHNRWG